MKHVLALILLFSVPSMAASEEAQLCIVKTIKEYRPQIDLPNRYDKYKHCAFACVLALKCGPAQAWTVGVGKEIADVFDHGDPDIEDLKADGVGIRQAVRKYATHPEDCMYRCSRIYPEPHKI